MPRARGRIALLAVALCLGVLPCATACAADPGLGPGAVSSDQDATAQPDDQDDQGDAQSEGEEDPVQATRIDGIALGINGPSNGDIGQSDLGDGTLCQGVTMFWSPQVPAGVTYTVTSIAPEPADLVVEAGTCGDYPVPCTEVVLGADESVQCGVILRPTGAGWDDTTLRIAGTIDCPDAATCAQLEDYRPDQAVAVVVEAQE